MFILFLEKCFRTITFKNIFGGNNSFRDPGTILGFTPFRVYNPGLFQCHVPTQF